MTRSSLVSACLLAACSSGTEPPSPASEGSAEVVAELPAEPQLPSGAELLTGEFEYVAAHHGTEIRRAVRIADGLMTRLVDGRVTSEAPYTIVETRPGRVTVEISETGRPPARRSFEFSDADHMVDVVTPELLFARVEDPTTTTTAPSEGSASD